MGKAEYLYFFENTLESFLLLTSILMLHTFNLLANYYSEQTSMQQYKDIYIYLVIFSLLNYSSYKTVQNVWEDEDNKQKKHNL